MDDIPSDYSNPEYWYKSKRPVQSDRSDVFYVLPTTIPDWKDADGKWHHFANPLASDQRELSQISFEIGEKNFAQNRNYFAPYYHHITLESWYSFALIEERWPTAEKDLVLAFDYYIRHLNGERPFILAGFSQGAKGVIQLIKQMDPKIQERMIAAYALGYHISQKDLDAYPNLHPATDAKTPGEIICYNSVAEVPNLDQIIFHQASDENVALINPVSWKCDEEPAELEDNLTVPFWNDPPGKTYHDPITVKLDKKRGLLIVSGMSPERYKEIPEFRLGDGNLHFQEPYLYQEVLKQNADVREQAWIKARKER